VVAMLDDLEINPEPRTLNPETSSRIGNIMIEENKTKVILNANLTPPQFSGENGKDKVADWIYRMDLYFQSQPFTDRQKVYLASCLLSGAAFTWWRFCQDRATVEEKAAITWEVMKRELKKNFQDPNELLRARRELHLLKQKGSVLSYIIEFRNLCLKINGISEDEMYYKFIFGLKDKIQEEMLKRLPDSLEEVFIMAENMDRLGQNWYLNAERARSSWVDYNSKKSTYEPMEIDKVELKKLTDQERGCFMREGRCFKCREVGHISRECPGKDQRQ
jgi:hypothetical protein